MFDKYRLRYKLAITSKVTREEYELIKEATQNIKVAASDEEREEIDKILNQIKVLADPKQWFWIRRRQELRLWNWFLIVGNAIFQTNSLMKPKSDDHIIVNICYSISTISCLILNLLSYKEGWTICVYAGSIILAIRQAIRLADFENTKPSLFIKHEEHNESKIEVYTWLYIMVMQSLGFLATLIL